MKYINFCSYGLNSIDYLLLVIMVKKGFVNFFFCLLLKIKIFCLFLEVKFFSKNLFINLSFLINIKG